MEFILALIGIALVLYPMWKITERSGLNPLWTALCVLPFGIVVLLWMIALRPSPGGRA
jgi:hypothetical protein